MGATRKQAGGGEAPRRQDLDITDTPLSGAYEAISLFSKATRSQRIIIALWAAHAYTYKLFPVTPRLNFAADEPGAGKSTHLKVAVALANGSVVGYTTQAAFYNHLDRHPEDPIGLDETDKIFGTSGRRTSRDVLRSVINEGYEWGGVIWVTRGEQTEIPVFAPLALAGIGRLPSDTLDRSIVITLEKALPDQIYLPPLHRPRLNMIGQMLGEWLDNEEAAASLRQWDEAHGHLADIKGDPRRRLIYAPLAAIAAHAGMHDQFLEAANEIESGIVAHPPASLAELLLRDLREAWDKRSERTLDAADVIMMLRGHQSRRWDDLSADKLGEIVLGSMLRESGIRSRTSNGKRGYRKHDVMPRALRNASHSEGQNREQRTENDEEMAA